MARGIGLGLSDILLHGSLPAAIWALACPSFFDVASFGISGTISPHVGNLLRLKRFVSDGNVRIVGWRIRSYLFSSHIESNAFKLATLPSADPK